MTLIVDSREPDDIIRKLCARIRTEKEFIEVGDYLLPDGYAIERKKGNDLMASVGNNRLFEQLNALYEFDHPVLCIVSDNIWKDFYFSKNRFIHKQFIGTLTTLTCKYPKLKTIFIEDDDMFVGYIQSLHNKLLDDGHSERPTPIHRKSKSMKVRSEDTLTCAEGVGIKTAKRILKHFGSIDNLCDAKLEDIQLVKKVPKNAAENVYNLIHYEYK